MPAAPKIGREVAVVSADCGQPAHVLLSFEDYQKLPAAGPRLLESLAQKDDRDFVFEPTRLGDDISRRADLG